MSEILSVVYTRLGPSYFKALTTQVGWRLRMHVVCVWHGCDSVCLFSEAGRKQVTTTDSGICNHTEAAQEKPWELPSSVFRRVPLPASVIWKMAMILIPGKYWGSAKTENRDASSLPKKLLESIVQLTNRWIKIKSSRMGNSWYQKVHSEQWNKDRIQSK